MEKYFNHKIMKTVTIMIQSDIIFEQNDMKHENIQM